ncbi:10851_t:CDS:2 [Ambispora leptoticha]|uniref:10851_t:CDS:1 n=1 Tax=Ambispora leptoticha TaxID=144679 RepID=A0A9N8Z5J5_9GLOM|nr:10851_t:CDS:2 [Ambispora leptoticha]
MPSTMNNINIDSSNIVIIDNNNNVKKKRNIFQKSGSKIASKSKKFCRLFNGNYICKGKSKKNTRQPSTLDVQMVQETKDMRTAVSYQGFNPTYPIQPTQVPIIDINNDVNVNANNSDVTCCNYDNVNDNSISNNLKTNIIQQTNRILDETITSISDNNLVAIDSTTTEYQLTAYDIAWAAMIPTPKYKQTKDPRDFMLSFPECFRWLVNYQDLKGSWGKIGVKSIVPSLSSLLSLKFFRACAGEYFQEKLEDIGITTDHFQQVVAKGEAFLRKTLKNWNIDDNQPITSYEKMILYYLEELEKFNPPITFDFPSKQKLRNNNLINNDINKPLLTNDTNHRSLFNINPDYIPIETLMSIVSLPQSHSPDFFILQNNYQTSPAATASYLILAPYWDQEAFGLLQNSVNNWRIVLATIGQNIKTTSTPYYDFESCFVIECLGELIMDIDSASPNDNNFSPSFYQEWQMKFEDTVKYLRDQLEEQDGIFLTRTPHKDNKSLYEINCTALVLRLITQFDPLNRMEVEPFIQSFWNGKYFSHLLNHNQKVTSTIYNAHALTILLIEREKLKTQKKYRISYEVETALGKQSFNLDYLINSTILFIQSQRTENFVWLDDAPHATPWYTTMQTIKTLLSLVEHPRTLVSTSFKNKPSLMAYCRSTIDHALATQHPDGSWGETPAYDALGNLEETSYVVRLLKIANEYWASDHALMNALARGCDYLLRHFDAAMNDPSYFYNCEPPLWGNYMAQRLIRASILCALSDPSLKNKEDNIDSY